MAKNLYNLTAVTTVNDSDLLHVNQGSVSSDKKVTKQNLLKEVNSSITSLNNSLTNGKLHNADHYFSNISVGSALYVDLGDIESVFGIPAGSYIVSAFIRGWSGNPGALSLVVSSNGKNLYLMCSATGTVSSVTVRVWYCATN